MDMESSMLDGMGGAAPFLRATPEGRASMSVRERNPEAWLSCVLLLSILAFCLLFPRSGAARNIMFPHIAPPRTDLVGVGVGFYPQYMGATDFYFGAAPLARVHFDGDRYFQLLINELRVNLLDDSNWSFGPIGLLRFGRSGLDDNVVNRMQDIHDTVELGGFLGYSFNYGENPLEQAGASVWAQGDVGGVHDGWIIGASASGLYPLVEFLTLTAGVAGTWASEGYNDTYFGVSAGDAVRSGLPEYSPGAGMRDVRGYSGLIFHFSRNWHVGAGVMYSHILGVDADSPIVDDRGTASQWAFGSGVIYSW